MGKEKLKGFKDYADYLSYVEICCCWLDAGGHKLLYDYLLKVQDTVDPLTVMRRMGAEAHAKLAREVTA